MKSGSGNIFLKRFVLLLVIFNLQYSIFNISSAQLPNTWTQKAAFPGTPRIGAVAFTIGAKGYVGTGEDSSLNLLNDFWEYDPSTNAWTQLADFGGSARRGAVAFAIGSKGYVGTGFDGTNNLLDFWEFDPSSNAWAQKRSLGSTITAVPRRDGVAFTINDKGYVATGYDGTIKWNKECWQFDGDTTWVKKADVGSGSQTDNWRRWATAFAIDTTAYIGCGFTYSQDWRNDFWRYNLSSNTWTQMADFGGTARSNALGFAMNGKGYIGTGDDYYKRSDFWQYNPADNRWYQVADYAGGSIFGGLGFSIGGNGYAGLGRDSAVFRNDFWQYAPDSTIGVNDLPEKDFDITVFPNPCGGKLFVKGYSLVGSAATFDIYNSSGQKFNVSHSLSHKNAELNTSVLPTGIYFLVLNSEKGKVVRKFLKR